jgi:hypothetical protein
MEKLCFLDRTASLQTQFIKQVPPPPPHKITLNLFYRAMLELMAKEVIVP